MAGRSSTQDPGGSTDNYKIVADTTACGLITLRIFARKDLRHLVESIEESTIGSGRCVELSDSEKINEVLASIDDAQAKDLIESLLPFGSEKSLSVTEALQHPLFARTRQPTSSDGTPFNVMSEMITLCQAAVDESKLSNVLLKLAIHNFVEELELGSPAFAMNDDGVGAEPIFLLRVQRSYLLHVSVEHQHLSHPPFPGLTWLALQLEDGERIELPKAKFYTEGNKLGAIALLEIGECDSTKMQSVSPSCGTLEEKYVNVKVLIGVEPAAGGKDEGLELQLRFCCRMCSHDCRFYFQRFMRSVAWKWARTPQWAKVLTREAAVAASCAAGVLL